MINEALGDDVDDLAFALDDTEHAKQASREQFAALPLGKMRGHENVGQDDFVFRREEDDLWVRCRWRQETTPATRVRGDCGPAK